MYFVYVLQSKIDKKYYYGQTADIEKRLKEHNSGFVRSTKNRKPFDLIYYEKVTSPLEARRREKYFKSGFGRKYVQNKIKHGPIV